MVWAVGKSNNNTHMYVVVKKELQKMEPKVRTRDYLGREREIGVDFVREAWEYFLFFILFCYFASSSLSFILQIPSLFV